jgi:hypothetical protein
MRDDFPQRVRLRLAARAGHVCSNPECRASTSGPQLLDEKSVSVGVAAHISGAAPGGPRYDSALPSAQRASAKNGIWLCQTCSKLIDADEQRYTVAILSQWKHEVEQEAHHRVGKARAPRARALSAERQIKRDLRLRDEMRRDILKGPKEYTSPRAHITHPYEKFRHSEAIIHRIDNDCYPEIDDGPGISSWFKVELFDFYHGGIKVILGIKDGVIGKGFGNPYWAIIPFQADFDREHFRESGIWELRLIPFRNIRHYDPQGDANYPQPHLYYDFSINGMPYEGFENAVVGKNEYDWPLKPEMQLPAEAVLLPAAKRAPECDAAETPDTE